VPEQAQRALVLLHGLMGHVSNWDSLVEHFRTRYRVYPIDFDIFDPKAPYFTVESLTECVREKLNELGVGRTVVFGNSMGGQIAINFALTERERVDGLVLTGSAGLLERSLAKDAPLNPSREYMRERAKEVFYNPALVTDEIVEDLYRTLGSLHNKLRLVKLARSVREFDLHDLLPEVTAPTLLIWGRQDTITPVSVAQTFTDRLPNARLRVLDRCGHAPNIERPEEFNRLVEEFLAEIGY
jgi:pimeloyl-ACP methyl ester carboxylesterase